ncbi:hypothetical protein MYSTI_05032 [Myxococcus stipitatus DSM 14675]|uniref:FAD-binding FR-type domain-containing protein n=1 Tax=Myxococcus stipitatus (strain DSM 14675 / JCM 12634 / Mx s8) TaxID=1278073 RepID=L7UEM2_MYXSD|nr:siderophore-interacting protein [Myxococcus stipitatus]AGC46320.1 hypothetical protein MYSTI_05032 [Myxococcus stipitatus DSM 14675]
MASGKAILGGLVGRFLFREARVGRVRELSPHFRWLEVGGEDLRDVEWSPGDKVQVFLPGIGMRTYTPLVWDSMLGSTQFLVYLHGNSPGAQWGRTLKLGDRCQLFGPRDSLPLDSLEGPVVLFGDETSFAVGHTLKSAKVPSTDISRVFEVSSATESLSVLSSLDMGDACLVERRPSDAHLAEVESKLRTALQQHGRANLVLTGRAQSIQTLRARLRTSPIPFATQKVKAYWSEGKVGLD